MRYLAVGLAVLLGACGNSETDAAEPDRFTTQDAEKLCIQSVQWYLQEEQGDRAAYDKERETGIWSQCDRMLSRSGATP